jgi:hypothetical protein
MQIFKFDSLSWLDYTWISLCRAIISALQLILPVKSFTEIFCLNNSEKFGKY